MISNFRSTVEDLIREDVLDQEPLPFRYIPLSDDAVSALLAPHLVKKRIKEKEGQEVWRTSQEKEELSRNLKGLAEIYYYQSGGNTLSDQRATDDIWSFSNRGYIGGAVKFILVEKDLRCPLIFSSEINWYLLAPRIGITLDSFLSEEKVKELPDWMEDKIWEMRVRKELRGEEDGS